MGEYGYFLKPHNNMYMCYAGAKKMTEPKRYVPPGARPKVARGSSGNHGEDSQRSLDDVAKDQGGDVFTVKLRSDNNYSKNNEQFLFFTYFVKF